MLSMLSRIVFFVVLVYQCSCSGTSFVNQDAAVRIVSTICSISCAARLRCLHNLGSDAHALLLQMYPLGYRSQSFTLAMAGGAGCTTLGA